MSYSFLHKHGKVIYIQQSCMNLSQNLSLCLLETFAESSIPDAFKEGGSDTNLPEEPFLKASVSW